MEDNIKADEVIQAMNNIKEGIKRLDNEFDRYSSTSIILCKLSESLKETDKAVRTTLEAYKHFDLSKIETWMTINQESIELLTKKHEKNSANIVELISSNTQSIKDLNTSTEKQIQNLSVSTETRFNDLRSDVRQQLDNIKQVQAQYNQAQMAKLDGIDTLLAKQGKSNLITLILVIVSVLLGASSLIITITQ